MRRNNKKISALSEQVEQLVKSVDSLAQTIKAEKESEQQPQPHGKYTYETDNAHARIRETRPERPMNPDNPFGFYL